MNYFILQKYIQKLKKQDLINYINKQNINLTNKELDIIYNYIKKRNKEFLNGNQEQILKELKQKITPTTYQTIEKLYTTYKNKI